jgi:hypothetical protein
MAGGPLLPSSVYLGGASGNLSPQFYIGTTASGSGAAAGYSAMEGIAAIASLTTAAAAQAVLQFNLPEVIPTGTLKLRTLAMAAAASGAATWAVHDAVTAAGVAIGASSFTTETTQTITWSGSAGTTVDNLIENKQNLTPVAVANGILTCVIVYAPAANFTLAQQSVWQFSVVWE